MLVMMLVLVVMVVMMMMDMMMMMMDMMMDTKHAQKRKENSTAGSLEFYRGSGSKNAEEGEFQTNKYQLVLAV